MGFPFRPKPTSSIASICLMTFIFVSFSNTFVSGQSSPSAYQVLQQYDFPVGLLPKGITGYELDIGTGRFKAYLNKTCKFSIDSYELEYKTTITGVIGKDRLKKLKGVSVKVILLWLNIVEVVRGEDELQFSVGIASANFPIDSFYESPQCGCGFNCDNLGALVSSS